MSGIVAGVDGGGTHSTVALAGVDGREIIRMEGPPGLVDPRDPAAAARTVAALVAEAMARAGLREPPDALCAALAGVGNGAERQVVHDALLARRAARRVAVIADGEAALEGALEGEPGILLAAGTGSVAYGRAEDGRVERCGGWGWLMGDEGSAVALSRAALRAALRSVDGRGPATALLPRILERLGTTDPAALPPWAGRASKGEIAGLAPLVCAAAERDDWVAAEILEDAAGEMALHAAALARRLGPWTEGRGIVFHGGMFRSALFTENVESALRAHAPGFQVRPAAADAVAGAVRLAGALRKG